MTYGWLFKDQCLLDEASVFRAIELTYPIIGGDGATLYILGNYQDSAVFYYPYTDVMVVKFIAYYSVSANYTTPQTPTPRTEWYWLKQCVVEDFQTVDDDYSGVAVLAQDAATIAALNETVAGLNAVIAVQSATVAETQTGLQSLLNAAAEDFDPVFAGAVFGFFYCTVFVFYSISKGIGAVLAAVKGG